MTANELRKLKLEAVQKAKAIQDGATVTERELTEDEDTTMTSLLDEADGYEAQALAIEHAATRQARLDTALTDLETPRPPMVDPGPVAQPGVHVEVGRELWQDDMTWGWPTVGQQFKAIKLAGLPGAVGIDERLLRVRAAQGANTISGEEGDFLIAPQYSNRIFERVEAVLPVLAQCDRLTLSSNQITINGQVDHARNATTYRYGGVVIYWVAEAGQITRSNLKFRQITLKLNKLGALSYVTEEEMSDANINFGERLFNKMAYGIADELVEAVMFGTGVGQPQGAFNSDACISVTKEIGQAADTIVFENLIKASSNLWEQSYGRANWYYNQECLPQLRTMVLNVGTAGIPVWLPGNLTGGIPTTIDGRPAFSTEHCAALGDTGDVVVGDFGQYLLAIKGSINTAMSIHLRFDYDEIAFKATFRVDGRPAWEQSLRPRKGATAKRVSPWVKIAAR